MYFASQIEDIIGSAPLDLLAYYDSGVFPNYPSSRINCLPFDQARDYSQKVRGIPAVDSLGLWVLDDANDSNPFAYISKGPCAGMIIHFSHDPEPQMAFSSLKSFLVAMHNAGNSGLDIDEIPKESLSLPLNQTINELAKEGSDDGTFLLITYLPVTATLDKETKDLLVTHQDFFVREAFAQFLVNKPSEEDLSNAELLSKDKHPQVARPGKAALAAVKKKRYLG